MIREMHIKDKKTTDGFSLIELLIVIVLIGLLSVIGFGYYQTYLKKGRDAQRKSDLQSIRSGLEMYRADTNSYPTSDANYKIVACGLSCPTTRVYCDWNIIWSCGSSTYMQKLPKDPRSGTSPYDYHYIYDAGTSTYRLEACLENSNDTDVNVIAPLPSEWGSNCTSNKVFQLKNP